MDLIFTLGKTLGKLLVLLPLVASTTAFGQTWTPILDTDPNTNYWTTVASSSDGATLVAAAVDGPIVVSTNFGVNWTETTAPYADWHQIACSADGAIQVAVAGGDQGGGPICISTNTGATWTVTTAPRYPWTAVACSVDGAKMFAIAVNSPVFVSTNAGITWTPRTFAFIDDGGFPAIACSTDGMKLIAASGNLEYPIYTSSYMGMTWTPANT